MAKSVETTLLVDADVIAYQHAAKAQKTYDWGDGQVSIDVDELPEVVDGARTALKKLSKKFDANIVLCFSDPDVNFRKAILPSYKGNRKAEKPVLLKELRAELSKHYKTYMRATLEGDDVIGILATWPKMPGRKIAVSIDKDLQQIPGELYNPGHDTLVKITKEQGFRYHMQQTLTGDAVDGYKGCEGCGPVMAQRTLQGWSSHAQVWERVIDTYHACNPCPEEWDLPGFDWTGVVEDEAIRQARVAKILQAENYNFTTKEPILWLPPSCL